MITCAEAIISSMTGSVCRASALAIGAEALAEAGDVRAASRLAAASCGAGLWTIALRPVLRLAPSAYTTLTLGDRQLTGVRLPTHLRTASYASSEQGTWGSSVGGQIGGSRRPQKVNGRVP